MAVATALFAATVELDGALGLALLLAVRAGQGAAAALTWTAGLALIAVTHPPERRGAVLGLALSASGIGVLLGPLLTGVLADLYGLRAPFLLIAVLVAADAVARIMLIKQLPVHPNPTPLRALARGPQVGLLIALTAVGAAATAFAEPVLPLHLSGLGLGPSGIGLAFGAAALGGAIAAPLAGLVTARFGPSRVAAAGALVTAAGFVLCGMPAAGWSVTGLVLVGSGLAGHPGADPGTDRRPRRAHPAPGLRHRLRPVQPGLHRRALRRPDRGGHGGRAGRRPGGDDAGRRRCRAHHGGAAAPGAPGTDGPDRQLSRVFRRLRLVNSTHWPG